jgi:hypothetical protein
MHSEGNFHFYDPVSKHSVHRRPGRVNDVGGRGSANPSPIWPHIPRMEGFHRRYMVSNKILRLWVRMARQLDIAMLVPQHGAPIKGPRPSAISSTGSKT